MSAILERETESVSGISEIIEELDREGYCVLPDVLSPEKTDKIRSILENILAAEPHNRDREAPEHQRVWQLAVKHPAFMELLCHPYILAIWEAYLAKDIICATWTANTLFPGHESYGWHTDWPYWTMEAPYPAGKLTGQTLWLLDDFTEENGATGVLPGSHTRGYFTKIEGWPEGGKIVTAPKGSVILLHGAIWHTARPNHSAAPRSALLGVYSRPCVVPQEDMRAQLAKLPDASALARKLLGESVRQPTRKD